MLLRKDLSCVLFELADDLAVLLIPLRVGLLICAVTCLVELAACELAFLLCLLLSTVLGVVDLDMCPPRFIFDFLESAVHLFIHLAKLAGS